MSKQFDYLKHPRMVYIIEEHAYIYAKLGVVIGFGSSSSTNGSNEKLGFESLQLSRVLSIEDGTLRFRHVSREKEVSRDLVRLILNWCLRFSYGSSNPNHYNSSNERPILIHLIKWIVIRSDATTYPSHLSENVGLRLNALNSHRLDTHEHATSLVQLNKQKIVPYDKNKCKSTGI